MTTVKSDGHSPDTGLTDRMAKARVTASSAKGVVTVVYDGHGDGVAMELKPGARRRYDAESLAGFTTSAFGAADRALEALHQHAFDDLPLPDGTLGQWHSAPPDATRTVAECFGTRE